MLRDEDDLDGSLDKENPNPILSRGGAWYFLDTFCGSGTQNRHSLLKGQMVYQIFLQLGFLNFQYI